jgi:hypothetical protein
MKGTIKSIYLSATHDCSVKIEFPDGSSTEVTLIGESMPQLDIDQRFAKIKERALRHIDAAHHESKFEMIGYRGHDYKCRKIWWRERQVPETTYEETLIMTTLMNKVLMHDTQCDISEIMEEANAVDARCAFSLDNIEQCDRDFIENLEAKYSDVEFLIDFPAIP